MKRFTAALTTFGALVLSACVLPPVNREADGPLPTAENVDVERYLGLWHEIARYDHGFERGCLNVTAEYARRDDGLIEVVNTCRDENGEPTDVARGRARIVDAETNAQLEVSFFGPFWGDYWIIDVADDYSWSLVGEPSGRFLWILARTERLPEDVLAARLSQLQALGYDTDELIYPYTEESD